MDGCTLSAMANEPRGLISCLDIETGETIWDLQLPKSRTGFSSSPLVAANHLYVTGENATTYVIGPLDAEKPELVATNLVADDEPFTVASLVPAGETLLLRSVTIFIAVDRQLIWRIARGHTPRERRTSRRRPVPWLELTFMEHPTLFDMTPSSRELLQQLWSGGDIPLVPRRGLGPGARVVATRQLEGRTSGSRACCWALPSVTHLGHSTEWQFDPETRHKEFGTIVDHVPDRNGQHWPHQ